VSKKRPATHGSLAFLSCRAVLADRRYRWYLLIRRLVDQVWHLELFVTTTFVERVVSFDVKLYLLGVHELPVANLALHRHFLL